MDPPLSNMDIISFRNVMIYLDQVLQKKIIPVLHYALKPSGFLILGQSENIGGFTNLFRQIDKSNKIFQKKVMNQNNPVFITTGILEREIKPLQFEKEKISKKENTGFDPGKKLNGHWLKNMEPIVS